MKKEYNVPRLEVEEFEIEDVITRSGPGRLPDDDEEELLGG